jgi:hypothetical protein
MMDRQSQDDLKKATLPPALEASKLPTDLRLPGDQSYKFDPNDPSIVAARNWAHAKGLSQDEFSQVLSIYASHVAGEQAILAERSRQEMAKAGVNTPQRVDAVGKWIAGEMGEADAKPIKATIVTDAHLRFYEKLMNKVSSQGTASFSQSHRTRELSHSRLRENEFRTTAPGARHKRGAEEFPMNMKRIAAALFFFCLSVSAFAQQQAPFIYPVTLGTSQVTILPANNNRKKVLFQNPNATALVAICPAGPSRSSGAAITAAINGPGCQTLLPYQKQEIVGGNPPAYDQMPSAWIGIASARSSALTILEWEQMAKSSPPSRPIKGFTPPSPARNRRAGRYLQTLSRGMRSRLRAARAASTVAKCTPSGNTGVD